VPKSTNPLAYQKKRSPKKSTRPVVGPGKEPEHIRNGITRGWVLVFVAIICAGGIALGIVLSLGGSSTPTTTTTVPLGATTSLPVLGTTTTVPGGATTTAPTTSTTTPATTTST
jgi:hypothetical protein